MLFNSFTYLLFLALVVYTYWLLPSQWRNSFLLLSSYIFYGAWKLEGLLLLLGFSIGNYLLATLINFYQGREKKIFLILGIIINLVLLTIFKYYSFIFENLTFVLNGNTLSSAVPRLILPLGISFFVFEAISFLVDVYKTGVTIPRIHSFALYISFFPHLIAGPIVRVQQFNPQLYSKKIFSWETFFSGIDCLCIGAFKKVVLADNLAILVDASFKVNHASAWDIWITGSLFSLQIYLDFAGYTDMARGAAKLLDYDLPINFDFPYVSRSVSEFWRRWHITLSNWFRDYLYIPLGGNRTGQNRTYLNLLITMGLCGLWHGAGWTYVIWGLYHGIALIVHRVFAHSLIAQLLFQENLWGRFFAWILTYLTLVFGWIIFRVHDVFQLVAWIQTLITPTAYIQSSHYLPWSLVVVTTLIVSKLLFNFRQCRYQFSEIVKIRPIFYVIALFLLTLFAPQGQQFIYFNF